MTHPITDDLAENLQARAPVQGEPVYWEWRHLSTHPDTVDFGKWSEWKRVEARSAIHTIDDELAEFRTYIAQGHKYELRALYTTPQPAAGEPVMDVRCEGCGYMTHHREHMGCIRAAKQHTHQVPSVPDGCVLVPIEPTQAMLKVQTWDFNRFYSPREIWAAMLAAKDTK